MSSNNSQLDLIVVKQWFYLIFQNKNISEKCSRFITCTCSMHSKWAASQIKSLSRSNIFGWKLQIRIRRISVRSVAPVDRALDVQREGEVRQRLALVRPCPVIPEWTVTDSVQPDPALHDVLCRMNWKWWLINEKCSSRVYSFIYRIRLIESLKEKLYLKGERPVFVVIDNEVLIKWKKCCPRERTTIHKKRSHY